MHKKEFDKTRDAASYDTSAQDYDKYIRRLSAPLAKHICQLAQLKPGQKVLDVGTGSGIAARTATRLIEPDGSILGIDLSEGMISMANESVANEKGIIPQFRVMDAEALDLPDAAFDAVISLCAVRHFPEIQTGLKEMRRVLKPGGILVVSFGYGRPIAPLQLGMHITKRLSGKILNFARPQLVGTSYLIDLAHKLLPEPAQAVLTEWGAHGNPRKELVRRVHEAGFNNVEASWWGHEVVFDSVEEFWAAQTSIVTEVRKRLAEASPDASEKIKQMFFEKAESVLRRGGQLIYPYGAFYVSGKRTENY